jgi:hypothetical protein
MENPSKEFCYHNSKASIRDKIIESNCGEVKYECNSAVIIYIENKR